MKLKWNFRIPSTSVEISAVCPDTPACEDDRLSDFTERAMDAIRVLVTSKMFCRRASQMSSGTFSLSIHDQGLYPRSSSWESGPTCHCWASPPYSVMRTPLIKLSMTSSARFRFLITKPCTHLSQHEKSEAPPPREDRKSTVSLRYYYIITLLMV